MLGDHPVKGDQGGHQRDVGLHHFEQLGLEEELAKAEALHGIGLHDPHDAGGKVCANVAKPARDLGGRATEAGVPGRRLSPVLPGPPYRALVVQRTQGGVAGRVVAL